MLARFFKDGSGAMIVEYGLIAAIIAVSVIGGAMMIGSAIDGNMTTVATNVGPPPA